MIPVDRLPQALADYKSAHEFAVVDTLTKTAKLCQTAARESLKKEFTLRNAWTEKSVAIMPATMVRPEAEVFVRDQYIADQEEGNTRPAAPDGLPIPSEIRQAASIPENKVIPKSFRAKAIAGKKKLIKKNKPFIQEMKSTLGVWVREGAARLPVQLLYVIRGGPRKIKKRKWYQESVNKAYEDNIEPEYNAAIDRALERWKERTFK